MPIEFRCTECGKLLRVADGSVGRQAKCPSCGAIVTVTEPPAMPAGPEPVAAGPEPFAEDHSSNPYQAPADLAAGRSPFGALPISSSGGIRPTRIEFSDVFSHAWQVFTDNWGMCLAVAVACIGINFVAGQVAQGVGQVIMMTAGPAGLVVFILLVVCAQIFGLWLNIGQAIFFIKTARGQTAEFTDIFTGGPYLLRVLGAGVIFALGLIVILGVCLAPGGFLAAAGGEEVGVMVLIIGAAVGFVGAVVFSLTFFQYFYLIIDQNLGIIDSLSESATVTSGNRLTMFGILFVAGIVGGFVILCTCGLGMLAVAPFMSVLYAVMYLLMIGQPTADTIGRLNAPSGV